MSTRRRPMHYSGRRRTLAVAVAVAASVVTPLAVYGASQAVESGDDIAATAGSGLPTDQVEVSLASAPDATGVDRDIAAGDSPVKEITSETPFSMMGVTWKGSYPEAMATVRAKNTDGSWGPWYEAESVDDQAASTTGTGGTEPVYLGLDTTAVQISLKGVDIADTSLADAPEAAPAEVPADAPDADADKSPADKDIAARADAPAAEPAVEQAAESAPAKVVAPAAPAETRAPAAPAVETARSSIDTAPPVPTRFADIKPVAESSALDASTVQAVLISPDKTPTPDPEAFADISSTGDGTYGDVAAKQPTIITRSGWGANESQRCRGASYDDSLAAGVVHHTAGSNNYSKAESAGVVRGIYSYHASTLGWCDVGYNVLVDKYGQAFEGRFGGLNRNVQGAHAGGFNGNTWGISMMGDYSTLTPPDVTVRKVGEILGWRLSVAGIDPKGTSTHYSEGTSYTKYSYGTAVKLPNIFAHRDVGNTSCPGNAGYAKMGQIRDIAASYAKGGGSGGGGGGGTTPTEPGKPGPSTDGGSTVPGLSKAGIQEAVTSALRTVLTGGKLDVQELTKALTGGMSLKDIPLDAGSVGDLAGGDIGALLTKLAGPLGQVLSGIQKYGDVSLVKTENGAVYSSPETGTHPVWGVIGDAWASQGFEHGPLGLPVSTEADRADGTVAQQFVGGTLVYNPATKEISVEPNP